MFLDLCAASVSSLCSVNLRCRFKIQGALSAFACAQKFVSFVLPFSMMNNQAVHCTPIQVLQLMHRPCL